MKEIAPTTPVTDVDKAVEFYTNQLGFEVGFNNAPVFAMVRRGGVQIGLQRAGEARPPGTGNCYIWVEDIRATYEEYSAKGVVFTDDIAHRGEYDLTDFVIHDPDGNHIGIGGR